MFKTKGASMFSFCFKKMAKRHISHSLLLVNVFCCLVLSGCGTGGDGSSSSGGAVTGRAMLGPLAGAEVSIYMLGDLVTPIYTTKTTESESLSEAGTFEAPADLFNPENLYIISITGGRDIDADDDGTIDSVPTLNSGKVHLVTTGESLLEGEFHVTVVSEVAYQEVAFLIAGGGDDSLIIEKLRQTAGRLLKTDFDGDGEIGIIDMQLWNPVDDKEALRPEWAEFERLISKIHRNESTHLAAKEITDEIVATFDFNGTCRGIAIRDNYAYLVGSLEVLQIVDVSIPQSPSLVSEVSLPSGATSVLLHEDKAYVSFRVSSRAGLAVVDISDPLVPILSASVTFPTAPTNVSYLSSARNRIAINGIYAYVADSNVGLAVVNIADPENPTYITTLKEPGSISGVSISDNFAYVAGRVGLEVYDIRNPNEPLLVSTFEMALGASDVWADGDYAYVLNSSGLYIFDIRDSLHPVLVSEKNVPGYEETFILHDSVAYIITNDGVLHVVDVSDPQIPTWVTTLPSGRYEKAIEFAGDFLYIGNWYSGLTVIDVGLLQQSSEYQAESAHVITRGEVSDVVVSGAHLIVAEGTYGLSIYAVGTTLIPTLLGQVDLPHLASVIAVSGNYVYAAGERSLSIVDIHDPQHPSLIHTMDIANWAPRDVKVENGYAYVHGSAGLSVIDIHEPEDPSLITTIGVTREKSSGDVKNGLYFKIIRNELQIFDISNPPTLKLITTFYFSEYQTNISVSDSYAYVINNSRLLYVLNIEDQNNPILISTFTISGSGLYLQNNDSNVYVANFSGLDVIDVRDQKNPILMTTVKIDGGAKNVTISGGVAYVTTQDGVLHVISVVKREIP